MHIFKFSSRRRPFTGAAIARSAKGVETPKLHQKFPLRVRLCGKPYLQTEFSQKCRSNPLKVLCTELVMNFVKKPFSSTALLDNNALINSLFVS